MTYKVILLPGDGIGPEVIGAAVRVLDAVAGDLAIEYQTVPVGGAAIDLYGTPLHSKDLERCRQADALLFGAVGGPAWDHFPLEMRPERALLRLRSKLGLAINLRPIQWTHAGAERSPLKPEIAHGTDIAFISELTGGVYFGQPSYVRTTSEGREAVDTTQYTEAQVVAMLDFAYELARQRRGKVTSVDKANVMNTSRLWREIAIRYGRENPDVELEHALVDSFAASLMQNPRSYDVVVTENLFGDILTDLAAVIPGSLGLLPSASLRPGEKGVRVGMYEPVHGSAPSIAGQDIANPVGCILSAALMLEWSFGRPDLASTVRTAVHLVLATGRRTADLAQPGTTPSSTPEFTDEVVLAIRQIGADGADSNLRHHVA